MSPDLQAHAAPLDTACRTHNGRQLFENLRYEFDRISDAALASADLGFPIEIEPALSGRSAQLRVNDRRLFLYVRFEADDEGLRHFVIDNPDRPRWRYRFIGDLPKPKTHRFDPQVMARVRKVGADGADLGWRILDDYGHWCRRSASSVKMVLQSFGLARTEAEVAMGILDQSSWQYQILPFQPEYPDPTKRIWNPDAPGFRVEPQQGDHPTWTMILSHVGSELDGVLPSDPWAQAAGIKTGGEYLQKWFASIVQEPFEPLPYLFFYGCENAGKSIIHEAFALVADGVVFADRALTNQNDFNGELAGAILCVVEEKNIAKAPGAYAKVKDAVTAKTLSIRKMRTDSYQMRNSTHWLQAANTISACPIFPGDTRFMALRVMLPRPDIGKRKLLELIEREAPAIAWSLLNEPLPKAEGRLNLAVVDTPSKRQAAERNVPDFVHAVVEFMAGRTTWHGTAIDLIAKLDPGDWPVGFQKQMAVLDANRTWLRQVGIEHARYDKRQKDGWHLQLTRT